MRSILSSARRSAPGADPGSSCRSVSLLPDRMSRLEDVERHPYESHNKSSVPSPSNRPDPELLGLLVDPVGRTGGRWASTISTGLAPSSARRRVTCGPVIGCSPPPAPLLAQRRVAQLRSQRTSRMKAARSASCRLWAAAPAAASAPRGAHLGGEAGPRTAPGRRDDGPTERRRYVPTPRSVHVHDQDGVVARQRSPGRGSQRGSGVKGSSHFLRRSRMWACMVTSRAVVGSSATISSGPGVASAMTTRSACPRSLVRIPIGLASASGRVPRRSMSTARERIDLLPPVISGHLVHLLADSGDWVHSRHTSWTTEEIEAPRSGASHSRAGPAGSRSRGRFARSLPCRLWHHSRDGIQGALPRTRLTH